MKISTNLVLAIVSLSLTLSMGAMAQTQTEVHTTRQRTTAATDAKDKTKKPGSSTNSQSGDRLEPDEAGRN